MYGFSTVCGSCSEGRFCTCVGYKEDLANSREIELSKDAGVRKKNREHEDRV